MVIEMPHKEVITVSVLLTDRIAKLEKVIEPLAEDAPMRATLSTSLGDMKSAKKKIEIALKKL